MIGVIHFAYGAPTSIDEVVPYFEHILNGKTPPAPMMEKIIKQFKKVGRVDPLASSTAVLQKVLSMHCKTALMKK